MIRHLVAFAGGVICLLTGIVLVQGGEPAGPRFQEPTGKTVQQPDSKKQQKAPPKEEEERTPNAKAKAPVRVGDEDGDAASGGPAARVADLTQEARNAVNPEVKKLFEELSPPHDLWTQSSRTIKAETVPIFILPGAKVPGGIKVRKLEPGKVNEPISVQELNTRSLLGFEQVVLERVNEFLKKDLDKRPEGDKERLTRLEMLREAEKALAAGILYNRSAKEQHKRDNPMWEPVGKQLEQRLAAIQLQQLRLLTDARDWNRAFELATSLLTDSFSGREGGPAEKGRVQKEVLNLLARQADDLVKERKYVEARRRLLQLQEKFPDSPELEPIRKELRNQASAVLKEAQELGKTDPKAARAKLLVVQDILPQLPGLRDEFLKLNNQFPTVAIGVRSLPVNLSPGLATTDIERQCLELVFESLVRLGLRPAPGERYQADLASDMPQVKSLARTFLLPHDAYWSDGEPLRAGDIKHTVGLMADPTWPGNDLEWTKLMLMGRSAQAEEDSFHITLRMQHGYLEPLGLMNFKILPETKLGKITDPNFARNPVGSGPYRFNGTDGDKSVFVANQYYGARQGRERLPKIREISLIKSTDPVQDFQRNPNFGMLFGIPSAKFKELQASLEGVARPKTLPNRRIYFLALNHRTSILQDDNFRRGLAHAIQREEILDACFREGLQSKPHRALNGPYPPGSWAADPSIPPYRSAFAKRELEAGKANRPAKTNLTLKYPDDDPAVARACELIKKQIEEQDPSRSLTIELQPRNPQHLHQEVEVAHDYQLAYYSHDYPTKAFWLWPLFQPESYLGYKNDDELEGRMRKLMGHRDPTAVQRLARQIHQRCFEKVPFVPLWQLDTHLFIRDSLIVPDLDALDPLALFRDAERWTLGKEPEAN
jgi:ABC-type oligopeptide transport system substrate-binding subunit